MQVRRAIYTENTETEANLSFCVSCETVMNRTELPRDPPTDRPPTPRHFRDPRDWNMAFISGYTPLEGKGGKGVEGTSGDRSGSFRSRDPWRDVSVRQTDRHTHNHTCWRVRQSRYPSFKTQLRGLISPVC